LPERSIGGRQLLDEVTARSGLHFNVVAESNSFEFLRGVVLRGGATSVVAVDESAIALDVGAQGSTADEIAKYRVRYPQVAFEVSVLDHERAMRALAAYDVDLVIVFRPPYLANFQPLTKLEQRLVALMTPAHPLASRRAVRLRDCAAYPVALPERSIGGRQLLDEVTARSGLHFNVVAESNSFEFLRGVVLRGGAISFQIQIGAMTSHHPSGVVARSIDDRDLPNADLVLGQLRGRNLPIPSAVFAEQLMRTLDVIRR